MNTKDTTKRAGAHPVKSAARRAGRRPSYLRLHRDASDTARHAAETVRRGDLAGHAMSLASAEAYHEPIRVARNVLRPSARPGAWERAANSRDEGLRYLDKHTALLGAQLERVIGTLGSMRGVAVNFGDREAWELLRAVSMLVEDAAALTHDVSKRLAGAA